MNDTEKMSDDQIEAESREFHCELGYCIATWTAVEIELLNILRLCMPETNFETLAASFYAVDNFRSKLAMVDTALGIEMKREKIYDRWTKKGGLHQRIVSASKVRNTLAHWMVIHLHGMKKPPSVYMVPNIFKAEMRNFTPTRPTGGYYVHDLKAKRTDFKTLSDDLQLFWVEWRGPPDLLPILKQQAQDRRRNPAPKSQTP